jgi:hypothetical protein
MMRRTDGCVGGIGNHGKHLIRVFREKPMAADVFRFGLSTDVPLDEAEMSLQLATFAVEGLFGPARVRLDLGYHLDEARHAIFVDGTNEVGATVARVFTNLLLREFGEGGFRVERLAHSTAHQTQEVAA